MSSSRLDSELRKSVPGRGMSMGKDSRRGKFRGFSGRGIMSTRRIFASGARQVGWGRGCQTFRLVQEFGLQ